MSLRIRKPIWENILEGSECEGSCSKIQGRRWRMAYRAIYFTRVLVSLTKKLLDQNSRFLSHSLSYIAIDVGIENPTSGDQSLLGVDKRVVSELVREKNLEGLTSLGGAQQVVQVLGSDPKRGVRDVEAEIVQRKNLFGENRYAKQPLKSFLSFVFESLEDTTIIILLVCAVLALGFGIKQEGLKDGWYDGGSIIVAVFLVVVVSSVSNFKQNRQFERLSDESSDIEVEVVRDGKRRFVSIFDIVVGDVVFLKIGDQVPADGLFLEGYSIKVDESSLTGESDYVEIDDRRPFLVSGTKVNDGYGVMVVTSVGMDTAWGKMMSVVSKDSN